MIFSKKRFLNNIIKIIKQEKFHTSECVFETNGTLKKVTGYTPNKCRCYAGQRFDKIIERIFAES